MALHPLPSALLLVSTIAAAVGLSACWVTEQCSVPGDEDGDGLEGCDDPDCFSRTYCGGFSVPPTEPFGDDDVFDDDDLFDDDDAAGASGHTFSFELTSTPITGGGDDDDSAEPPTDEVGRYRMEFEYVIHYWTDLAGGVPLCDQHIRVEGAGFFGPGVMDGLDDVGDCSVCTGYVELDPQTYEDISQGGIDPDHCRRAQISANDIGANLLTPTEEGGQGDFLELAFIDEPTVTELGITLLVSGEPRTDWASFGMRFTHAGYVQATPQSLAGTAGLDLVTRPPEAASDYLAAFEVAQLEKTPRTPPFVLEGDYVGQALFILTGF